MKSSTSSTGRVTSLPSPAIHSVKSTAWPYRNCVPIKSEALIQPSYTFLPDCIWVWIFSTTSPSWITSCLTLMPVISSKALARVCDSYWCTVSVSETALISIPLKGAAALMNHCISFIWSSLDNVEGWNSLSIHFFAAASSANAGAVIAAEAAVSATALVIIKTWVLVKGPLLLSKHRMLVSSVAATNISRPGLIPDLLSFSLASDGAENCHGRNKRNHGSEPQARQFNSFPDRKRRDRVGADQPDPQQMDDGGQNKRNEHAIAARRRNPQDADTFGFRIGDRQPGHDRQRRGKQREKDRGRRRPGHPCGAFHGVPQTLPSAKPRAM